MKKFVSIILLVMVFVLFTCSAVAEDFTVRGNISFNSTKDDIIAYEESVSSKVEVNPTIESYTQYYTDNCITCNGISYAGYDDAQVIYYFDNNDNLVSILYLVKYYGDDGERYIPDTYSRLDTALNDKYGNALSDAIAFTKDEKAYGIAEFFSGLSYCDNIKQRLFDDNGKYYVEIDIANGRYLYLSFEPEYRDKNDVRTVAISYVRIENEVVEELYQQAKDAEDALNNDL